MSVRRKFRLLKAVVKLGAKVAVTGVVVHYALKKSGLTIPVDLLKEATCDVCGLPLSACNRKALEGRS